MFTFNLNQKNDDAFRLSVGLEGLLSAAHASGDQYSAQE